MSIIGGTSPVKFQLLGRRAGLEAAYKSTWTATPRHIHDVATACPWVFSKAPEIPGQVGLDKGLTREISVGLTRDEWRSLFYGDPSCHMHHPAEGYSLVGPTASHSESQLQSHVVTGQVQVVNVLQLVGPFRMSHGEQWLIMAKHRLIMMRHYG